MFKQAYAKIRMFLGLGNKPPQEYEVMVTKEVADFMNSLPHEEQAKMLNVHGPDLGPDTTTMSIRTVTRDHPQLGKTGEGAHLGQMSFNPQARVDTRSNQQVSALVDLVPKGPWNRQKPTELGGNLLPLWNSHWKPGSETKIPANVRVLTGNPEDIGSVEELERFLEMKLTPQLATVDGQPVKQAAMGLGNEPDMVDPLRRRCLRDQWLHWCATTHGISLKQAWDIGAKSLIDNEFAHGTMRQNVEILPWDTIDPYAVKIKYHDPLDPNDPWFKKDEE